LLLMMNSSGSQNHQKHLNPDKNSAYINHIQPFLQKTYNNPDPYPLIFFKCLKTVFYKFSFFANIQRLLPISPPPPLKGIFAQQRALLLRGSGSGVRHPHLVLRQAQDKIRTGQASRTQGYTDWSLNFSSLYAPVPSLSHNTRIMRPSPCLTPPPPFGLT